MPTDSYPSSSLPRGLRGSALKIASLKRIDVSFLLLLASLILSLYFLWVGHQKTHAFSIVNATPQVGAGRNPF